MPPLTPLTLAHHLLVCPRLVVMTGAGASAESGIPTFRDALTGYWAKYSPTELATPQAFARDPARVTRWYDERRLAVLGCQPNAGHLALVELGARRRALGLETWLLTQNVDELHQRAGWADVVELHGSIVSWRCTKTEQRVRQLDPVPFPAYPPPSPFSPKGLLRPDVVWFHEALPEHALGRAAQALDGVSLYLAVGTSGVVYPAAGFLEMAKAGGALCVTINPEPGPQDAHMDLCVRRKSGAFLAELVQAMGS